jgi:hypothetical protein
MNSLRSPKDIMREMKERKAKRLAYKPTIAAVDPTEEAPTTVQSRRELPPTVPELPATPPSDPVAVAVGDIAAQIEKDRPRGVALDSADNYRPAAEPKPKAGKVSAKVVPAKDS